MSIPDPSDPDRQRRAQRRVEAQNRRLRIARWADREMPLVEYYATWGWADGRYCTLVEGQAMPA